MSKSYEVELFYGYEVSAYGVSHEFFLSDPIPYTSPDYIAIEQVMAEALDTSPDNPDFGYNSMFMDLPEALVARIKEDAVKEYLEGIKKEATPVMNTKIEYLYRDADNYKVHNECVIEGQMTEEQKAVILACLHEGEWFIPGAVGLPEERFSEWDEMSDHLFFELGEYSFSETTQPATVPLTCEALVNAFQKCHGQWEQLAAEGPDLDARISDAYGQVGPGEGGYMAAEREI